MNTILDKAAERLASAWLSDLEGGEYIAPFVATGIGAIFNKLREVSASGTARDSDRWARKIFAVPRRFTTKDQAADHIASLFLNWLPEDLRTCGAAIAKEERKSQAGAGQQEPSSSTAPVSFESVFADLKSNPKFREIKDLLGNMTQLSATWTPNQVEKLLRDLVRRFITDNRHIRRFLLDVNNELTTLPHRYAIATALASSELAVPMLRSNREIGKVVHKELQDLYITLFNKTFGHRIVSERRAYRPGQPDTDIEVAAREELATDRTLQTLVWSRLSPRSEQGKLRDDLVDISLNFNWEIKPVGSAPLAVTQEVVYRMLYNFCATVMLSLGQPVKMERLMAGPDWENFAPALLKPIGGAGWTAKPFCLDLLPGLVLYFVIKGLSPQELAALEAIIIAIMMAYLKRLAEKLRQLGEAAARVVDQLFLALKMIGRMVLQLILIVLGLAILVVGVFILFESIPVLAAAVVIALTAGVIVFILPDDDKKQPEGGASAAAGSERATFSFGHFTLVNFPVGYFPKLAEIASRLYQQGLKAVLAELSKFKSEDTVPVAKPL
jgi:hypothetical protein